MSNIPTLVQSISAHTTATGASSITPTLGSGSTAKNTLLLAVGVTATSAPTITTPAGWTVLKSAVDTTNVLAYALFALPNNVGGITSVAVTIGGTGVQGAVASIFEFNNMPSTLSLDPGTFNFDGAFGSFTTTLPAPKETNELWFITYLHQASTFSIINADPQWSSDTAATVSTAGSPNAQIDTLWSTNNGPSLDIPTVNMANIAGLIYTRIVSSASVPFPLNAGGGLFVGQGGNPAGSLQVPQPQGPGNFFSGSIGIG